MNNEKRVGDKSMEKMLADAVRKWNVALDGHRLTLEGHTVRELSQLTGMSYGQVGLFIRTFLNCGAATRLGRRTGTSAPAYRLDARVLDKLKARKFRNDKQS